MVDQHGDGRSAGRQRGRFAVLIAGVAAAVALAACVPPTPAAPPAKKVATKAPPTTKAKQAVLACTGPGGLTDTMSLGSTPDTGTCQVANSGDGSSGALTASLIGQSGTGTWAIVPAASLDCAGTSLAPGATCNVSLTFVSSGAEGAGSITLHVVAAGGATIDQVIAGEVGPDFDITVTPSHSGTVGTSSQFTADAQNIGFAPSGSIVTSFDVDDPSIGTLSKPSDSCADVAQGATCTMTFDWEALQIGSTFVTVTMTPDTGVSTTFVVQLEVTA